MKQLKIAEAIITKSHLLLNLSFALNINLFSCLFFIYLFVCEWAKPGAASIVYSLLMIFGTSPKLSSSENSPSANGKNSSTKLTLQGIYNLSNTLLNPPVFNSNFFPMFLNTYSKRSSSLCSEVTENDLTLISSD